jgi:hypothetical protein
VRFPARASLRGDLMDELDVTIDRISAHLRELPEVNPDAKVRLLIAVAAEREREREHAARQQQRMRTARRLGGGLLAAAALVMAVFLGTRKDSTPSRVASAPGSDAATTMSAATPVAQLAENDPAALEMAPRPVQFVFRSPDASRVDVVGDFNTWEKAAMVRDSASGLWSATLMVRPGRHVYAFIVNDSVWKRDPRAVAAPDADFGRPGSVLLVGRPGEIVK